MHVETDLYASLIRQGFHRRVFKHVHIDQTSVYLSITIAAWAYTAAVRK